MEENGTFNAQTYIRLANVIFLRSYDESNVMRLISAIFFLIKLDDNKRDLTINLIKTRVNGRIASKIGNLNNIYDILFELIHISNNYRRSQNVSRV